MVSSHRQWRAAIRGRKRNQRKFFITHSPKRVAGNGCSADTQSYRLKISILRTRQNVGKCTVMHLAGRCILYSGVSHETDQIHLFLKMWNDALNFWGQLSCLLTLVAGLIQLIRAQELGSCYPDNRDCFFYPISGYFSVG